MTIAVAVVGFVVALMVLVLLIAGVALAADARRRARR
jgi:hypothetical protein